MVSGWKLVAGNTVHRSLVDIVASFAKSLSMGEAGLLSFQDREVAAMVDARPWGR